MKMTFLLFCVIILNDTRFFSTSFAVHCCLVWCVGVPQSFLRSIMNVMSIYWHHSSQKKISKPQLKFPLSHSIMTKWKKHFSRERLPRGYFRTKVHAGDKMVYFSATRVHIKHPKMYTHIFNKKLLTKYTTLHCHLAWHHWFMLHPNALSH